MKDKNIWNTIGGKNPCSYKLKTQFDTFCKNKNNVTGLCNELSCPLANSFYATVREENEKIFLFIKNNEKINEPINLYDKIELDENYQEALKIIEEKLVNHDPYLLHKCKQRLTKLTQYLIRKNELKNKLKITPVLKGVDKVERRRAEKAKNKVNFEKNVEKELMERLKAGVYGEEIQKKVKRKYVFEESDESDLIKKRKKGKENEIDW